MSNSHFDSFNELDDEIKQEFYEDVVAAIKDIDECASILESGADSEIIARMFRSLHTVKGNCNMVFLSAFVDASHKLEDLFSDIRSGDIDYNDVYGKFAVTAVNVIKMEIDSLVNTQTADTGKLSRLEKVIDTIEKCENDQRLTETEKAIIAIQDGHFNLELVAVAQEHGSAFSFLDATDLEFFQFISDKQVQADPQCAQFLTICETLAKKLNAMLGRSIDEQQLTAAIIFVTFSNRISVSSSFHDISIEQIFFASGLLARMSGWSIASEVILQLKEFNDGSGAPMGLKDEEINPASQALALALEFSFYVMENRTQGYKSSLFTAVKAINSQKGVRFKERLIERFNQIIRTDYLTSQQW